MTADDIIDFWIEAGEMRWFIKSAAFDGALAIRFSSAAAAARRGEFDHWAETARGSLGLILLLDQVSRNVHRGSPLAFAGDAKALATAKAAVARGFHWAMPAPLAMWLVMPFEHSELLDDQERAIAMFATMGLDVMVKYAVIHRDIIAKFGRFPHRNPVLGRVSRPEELAFLAAGGFAG